MTKTRRLNYLLFAVGLLPFYLLPVWAGVFDVEYQFRGSQIGPLLAADMMGGTIAAALARFWIARIRWRPILLTSLLVCVFANFACVFVDEFSAMLTLRSLAGLAAGTYMAIVYADFAHSEQPDRDYSIALALQVAMGAVAIWMAPTVIEMWGRAGSFTFVGLVSLTPLALFQACPTRSAVENTQEDRQGHSIGRGTWFGLVTLCLFFVALSCVWVAVERLAAANGFEAPVITSILAAGLLFSFLGSATPALISSFFKRRTQILLGYAALTAAIIVIGGEPTTWLLAGGLIVYNFFYSYIIPYQTAWIAETDITGRTAVLIPVVQGIGVSIGPLIGGTLLGDENYVGVIWISVALLALSLLTAMLAGDPIAD